MDEPRESLEEILLELNVFTTIRPDNHRPGVTMKDHLGPASQPADATADLQNQRNRNSVREAHLHARQPHQDIDLTAILLFVTNLSVQMLIFNVVCHFGELLSSQMNPGFTVLGRW